MKLTVSKEPSLEDDYVDIKYRELTTPINQIIEICNQSNQMLLGEKDSKKLPIDISDIGRMLSRGRLHILAKKQGAF